MLVKFILLFFSIIFLINSILVITVQNSVYCALCLVLSFVSASSILFTLECEFLAIIFLLIYVGAIAILFVFVVMMLDIKTNSFAKILLNQLPYAVILSIFLLFGIFYVLNFQFTSNPYFQSFFNNDYVNWFVIIESFTEVDFIGQLLYSKFVVQFLMVGFVLLIAVIGAVSLLFNFNKTEFKLQSSFKQNTRNFLNSIF